MRIGIMQPYFLPYIGYWQLMHAVDTYVIYDDVNYIKGGWINRNFLLAGNTRHLFTVSLKGASPNKLIKDILVADDFRKLKMTIEQSYGKAPYFKMVFPLVQSILMNSEKNLAAFLIYSIKMIAQYCGLNPKFLVSSEVLKNNHLHGEEKVISICKLLGGTEYVNAIGGQALYNSNNFKNAGMTLKFLKSLSVTYTQFSNEFIPSLSIIDVLMFNSPEQMSNLCKVYELI
jgi:hypothetical protein